MSSYDEILEHMNAIEEGREFKEKPIEKRAGARAGHTPGPWHVNAIDSKRGRITGDETSEGWDKLQINGANCTVATVYRPRDARLLAAAPRMLALLKELGRNHPTVLHGQCPICLHYGSDCIGSQAHALIAEVENDR